MESFFSTSHFSALSLQNSILSDDDFFSKDRLYCLTNSTLIFVIRVEFLLYIFQASILLVEIKTFLGYYIQLEIDVLAGAINLERSPRTKKIFSLKTMRMKKLELFNLRNNYSTKG